jgi:predicted dehydrogenase
VLAHIPALKALPEYELRAISTNRRESAEAAGKAFGVAATFDNHFGLIAHPGVDLVVVTVKVAYHHELVSAALNAGKMVFCEWPLGRGLAEAIDLADRADTSGIRTAIGLQARFSPAVRYARDLISDGFIGDVLSTSLVGSGHAWGPKTDQSHAYVYDIKNGATTLTVSTLHALDALTFMLGDFIRVSATLAVRRDKVHVIDEDQDIPVSAPDQVAITGSLQSGAVASIFYRGGVSRGLNLHWEINGSEGDLVMTSANGNVQVANLKLEGGSGDEGSLHEIVAPPEYTAMIPDVTAGPPSNVAQIYAQLAKDAREGTHVVPGFAHAASRHRLLGAIEAASRTGVSQVFEG